MADDPPYLTIGTEVSAKYRGAFCEAKVKKVNRLVKIKVNLKDTGQPLTVTEIDVVSDKPSLRCGSLLQIKHPNTGLIVEAVVNKVNDQSTYTVVFNDGDINTLRRSQINLKGNKHFVTADTLDALPLTNPEHFSNPVLRRYQESRRRRMPSSSETDSSEESDEGNTYPAHLQKMLGKLCILRMEDRKKSMLVPVLVVLPSADRFTPLPTNNHLLVRSFKDSKFYTAHPSELPEFTREAALKNEDRSLKVFYEKALLYLDGHELPSNWDHQELLGTEEEEEQSSSDEEPVEEKDRFVAQLYKFMDDRGTPFNKAPTIGSRDLDLYRLYRLVQRLGGYNKVNNQMKWRLVASKMGLTSSGTAQTQAKNAYKRYLHAFEEFYRKLGSSMGTNSTSRSISRSAPRRSIIRGDNVARSPRTPAPNKKEEAKDGVKSSPTALPKVPTAMSPCVVIQSPQQMASPPTAKEAGVVRQGEAQRLGTIASRREAAATGSAEGSDGEGRRRSRREGRKEGTPSEESDDSRPRRASRKRPIAKASLPNIVETPTTSGYEELQKDDEDDKSSITGSSKTDDGDNTPTRDYSSFEFPPGSRLRVKYGNGKVQKAYEAKVLEADEDDSGVPNYFVHYAGWNIRYDEWIQKDRVLEVLFKQDPKKVIKMVHSGIKIPSLRKKAKGSPAPSGVSLPTTTRIEERVKVEEDRSNERSKPASQRCLPPRPTRSTSLEFTVALNTPARKRGRMSPTAPQETPVEDDKAVKSPASSAPESSESLSDQQSKCPVDSQPELNIPELTPVKDIRNYSVSSDTEPPVIDEHDAKPPAEAPQPKKSVRIKNRATKLKEQVAEKTEVAVKTPRSVQIKEEPDVVTAAASKETKPEPEKTEPVKTPARRRTKAELKGQPPGTMPKVEQNDVTDEEIPQETTCETARETRGAIKRGGVKRKAENELDDARTVTRSSKRGRRRQVGQEESGDDDGSNEEEVKKEVEECNVPAVEAPTPADVEEFPQFLATDETMVPTATSSESLPDTIENSSDQCNYEGSQSELEANMEVAGYFKDCSNVDGSKSPGEQSTVSDASKGSRDSDGTASWAVDKDKPVEPVVPVQPPCKKRKLGKKTSVHKKKDGAAGGSDEDTACKDVPNRPARPHRSSVLATSQHVLDHLKDGDHLKGDELINFLMEKITEVRTVYAELKAEAAALERKRKRYKKKQRVAVQALVGMDQPR